VEPCPGAARGSARCQAVWASDCACRFSRERAAGTSSTDHLPLPTYHSTTRAPRLTFTTDPTFATVNCRPNPPLAAARDAIIAWCELQVFPQPEPPPHHPHTLTTSTQPQPSRAVHSVFGTSFCFTLPCFLHNLIFPQSHRAIHHHGRSCVSTEWPAAGSSRHHSHLARRRKHDCGLVGRVGCFQVIGGRRSPHRLPRPGELQCQASTHAPVDPLVHQTSERQGKPGITPSRTTC
jgi:hypothetical protein